MAGLFGVIHTSAAAMDVIRRALDVSQNNVNNASTPGYVRQRLSFEALPFQPEAGLSGGVVAGSIESARSQYAESAVWDRQQAAGYASQNALQTASVEPAFDVTGGSGIPGAMNRLFQSLSALSAAPDDDAARNALFAQAQQTARSFAASATSLSAALAGAETAIRDTLRRVDELAGQIRDYNSQVRRDPSLAVDAGADARVHAAIEELAELANLTVLRQEDGTFTVLAGGQAPLVAGGEVFELSLDLTSGPVVLRDTSGRDITAQITGGRLGALVEFRNATVPGWVHRLDGLAAELGGRINQVVGAPVFSWLQASPASSLTVDASAPLTSLDPAALAAAAHTDAQAFAGQYAALAADVGRTVEQAKEDAETGEQCLIQARQMRADLSGVSLDEEAACLLELQRSYEAVARIVRIVDEMTEETLAMIR